MSVHEFARREEQREPWLDCCRARGEHRLDCRNSYAARMRRARGLPGAYRVENADGLTVARYIVDHRGIAWANILAKAPISAEDRKRRPIAAVLELIAAGELTRVQVHYSG